MSDVLRGSLESVGTVIGNVDTAFGVDGKSAYQIAVDNGFEGTETEWLESLKPDMKQGSITPEWFDRKYLEKCVTEYGVQITSLSELVDKVGRYINRGGHLGFVKLNVVDSENEVITNYGYINGDFMAVGSLSMGDITLMNLGNGDLWSVYVLHEQYIATKKAIGPDRLANGAVIGDKLAAEAVTENKIANRAVTGEKIASRAVGPEQLDREYWEYRVRIIVAGYSDLDAILEEDSDNISYRLEFSQLSPIKSFFGDGCFTAIKNDVSDKLFIENQLNGERFSYVYKSNEIVAESLNNKLNDFDADLLPEEVANEENIELFVEYRNDDSDEKTKAKIAFKDLYDILVKKYKGIDMKGTNTGFSAANIQGAITSVFSSLKKLKASDIAVVDESGKFDGENIEAVLGEIGETLSGISAADIAVVDESGKFDGENIEAVLGEIGATLAGISAEDIIKMNINQTATATAFGGLLANLRDNMILSCSKSQGWTDMPDGTGDVFINWRYGTNYQLQFVVDQTTGIVLTRIINRKNSSVYRGWRMADGSQYMKILALGDSICRGVRNSEKGFVGDLGYPYKNIGVSSATISNLSSSYDEPVTDIPQQLVNEAESANAYNPDIIIAEGGINDWSKGVSLGHMFDSSGHPITQEELGLLDRTTVIGSLEYLFYKMITLYPKAQRFFLITHKTYKTSSDVYCPVAANTAGWTQQDLHDAIVKCCKVYNVKVIDIYEDSMLNTVFSQYRSAVAYNDDSSVTNTEYCDLDGVHPLAYGYKECYVPIIRKAIGIGTAK